MEILDYTEEQNKGSKKSPIIVQHRYYNADICTSGIFSVSVHILLRNQLYGGIICTQ